MSYQEIVEELLGATAASRTTLRLERSDGGFPVVAEALAPGIRAIRNDTLIDVRATPTFAFFERERRTLVVPDCLDSDPPTPQALIDVYGVRAEILEPLVREGRIVGIVSVHYAPGPRQWTDGDLAALRAAAARVLEELELSAPC